MEAFQRFVVSMIADAGPSSVLDAGCGEGHLLAALRHALPEAQLTGVDASVSAVEYARSSFGEAGTFLTGDLLALPFDADAFDVVVCSEVLEHLEDPAAAFAELRRVARRRVVLTVPLEPWFKFFNDIARALRISRDPGHVQFWSRSGFRDFVSALHPGATFDTLHYYQAAVCDL